MLKELKQYSSLLRFLLFNLVNLKVMEVVSLYALTSYMQTIMFRYIYCIYRYEISYTL